MTTTNRSAERAFVALEARRLSRAGGTGGRLRWSCCSVGPPPLASPVCRPPADSPGLESRRTRATGAGSCWMGAGKRRGGKEGPVLRPGCDAGGGRGTEPVRLLSRARRRRSVWRRLARTGAPVRRRLRSRGPAAWRHVERMIDDSCYGQRSSTGRTVLAAARSRPVSSR